MVVRRRKGSGNNNTDADGLSEHDRAEQAPAVGQFEPVKDKRARCSQGVGLGLGLGLGLGPGP